MSRSGIARVDGNAATVAARAPGRANDQRKTVRVAAKEQGRRLSFKAGTRHLSVGTPASQFFDCDWGHRGDAAGVTPVVLLKS